MNNPHPRRADETGFLNFRLAGFEPSGLIILGGWSNFLPAASAVAFEFPIGMKSEPNTRGQCRTVVAATELVPTPI
ncbi:MAG TPA: hypothetical protein VLR26_10435 [Frankiaceae bacterium]|nr:hypothetical protein [Frankiaceae bacterium]